MQTVFIRRISAFAITRKINQVGELFYSSVCWTTESEFGLLVGVSGSNTECTVIGSDLIIWTASTFHNVWCDMLCFCCLVSLFGWMLCYVYLCEAVYVLGVKTNFRKYSDSKEKSNNCFLCIKSRFKFQRSNTSFTLISQQSLLMNYL